MAGGLKVNYPLKRFYMNRDSIGEKKATILLVNENEQSQNNTLKLIKANYNVLIATNYNNFLDLMDKKIDVVLSDLALSNNDNHRNITAASKQINPNTQVVIFSTYSHTKTNKTDVYELIKPVQPSYLLKTIKRATNRKAYLDERAKLKQLLEQLGTLSSSELDKMHKTFSDMTLDYTALRKNTNNRLVKVRSTLENAVTNIQTS